MTLKIEYCNLLGFCYQQEIRVIEWFCPVETEWDEVENSDGSIDRFATDYDLKYNLAIELISAQKEVGLQHKGMHNKR